MEGKVLVTGASGYIALHVVEQLLKSGYQVRGTVRSLKASNKLQPLKDFDSEDRLELVEADLSKDAGWDEAVKGCKYVLHVASPFPSVPPRNENEIIDPALEGTRRVLQSAQKSGTVAKFVVTSSMAAVHGETDVDPEKIYTEKDWSDVKSPHIDAYSKSKTLAEKLVWEFVAALPENERFDVISINPGLVIGPFHSKEVGTSVGVVKRIMDGTMPMIPRVNFFLCDVRDVAMAHVRALTEPEAVGNRHLIMGDYLWFKEMAQIIGEEFGPMGYKVPRMQAPYLGLWFYSIVDKSSRLILPRTNKIYRFSNERMKKSLKITPINVRTSVIDTAHSLIKHGIIKKTRNYVPPKEDPAAIKSEETSTKI